MTKGTAEATWLIEPGSDDISSEPGISSTDIAGAADGTIYVIDRHEARVVQLDNTGKVLRTFGKTGNGPGEFGNARAIAVREDQVYVGDGRGYIHVFSRAGEFIRSMRVPGEYVNLTDIAVLPNGNIAVASSVGSGMPESYAGILDPTGVKVHDLLGTGTERRIGARPLLSPGRNFVHLSLGGDALVVWYWLDNYLDVFDSAGTKHVAVAGCLPRAIVAFYAQQSPRDVRQSMLPITAGVAADADGTIRMASTYFVPPSIPMLRVRKYAPAKGELEARDYELPPGILSRVEFLGPGRLLLYHEALAERGVRMLRLH